MLVFPVNGSKVTDLGSASQRGNPSDSDKKTIPGDVSYASPEQWYGWNQSPDFSHRFVNDLYRLGSLLFFFFANCSATDAIQLKISVMHKKQFTGSDFPRDLPYIQYAFGEVLSDLRKSLEEFAEDLTDEITMIAEQLCEPDPGRRGDPNALDALHRPQHDMQPYVSRFNRLARKAEMKMI